MGFLGLFCEPRMLEMVQAPFTHPQAQPHSAGSCLGEKRSAPQPSPAPDLAGVGVPRRRQLLGFTSRQHPNKLTATSTHSPGCRSHTKGGKILWALGTSNGEAPGPRESLLHLEGQPGDAVQEEDPRREVAAAPPPPAARNLNCSSPAVCSAPFISTQPAPRGFITLALVLFQAKARTGGQSWEHSLRS